MVRSKFTKSCHFWNNKSNFASLFSVMKHKSSIIFQLKFYMHSKQGSYQSMNLVRFQVSGCWKPEILHFGGFLLSKSYKVSAKNVQKSCLYWHWRMMQILRKNWIVVPNMTWEILRIFTQTLKSLKISFWWAIFLQSISATKIQMSYLLWHWTVIQRFS